LDDATVYQFMRRDYHFGTQGEPGDPPLGAVKPRDPKGGTTFRRPGTLRV